MYCWNRGKLSWKLNQAQKMGNMVSSTMLSSLDYTVKVKGPRSAWTGHCHIVLACLTRIILTSRLCDGYHTCIYPFVKVNINLIFPCISLLVIIVAEINMMSRWHHKYFFACYYRLCHLVVNLRATCVTSSHHSWLGLLQVPTSKWRLR